MNVSCAYVSDTFFINITDLDSMYIQYSVSCAMHDVLCLMHYCIVYYVPRTYSGSFIMHE